MALARSPLARGGALCRFGERRVRRGGLTRGFGGCIQAPLQRIELGGDLLELDVQRSQMIVNRWWGLLPCSRSKGKSPSRIIDGSLGGSRHGPLVSRRSGEDSLVLIGMTGSEDKDNMAPHMIERTP